jgi:hypothetical protein
MFVCFTFVSSVLNLKQLFIIDLTALHFQSYTQILDKAAKIGQWRTVQLIFAQGFEMKKKVLRSRLPECLARLTDVLGQML